MDQRQPPPVIAWYRTPIPAAELKRLHRRSDGAGLVQSVGYLAVLIATGLSVYWAAGRLAWPWVGLLLLFHGTCYSFVPAAVHELSHGTVFRTRALNGAFLRLYSFLSWANFQVFEASHARHHRYTLHAPDDLEVVLPMKLMVRYFFLMGIVNPIADPFGRGALQTIAYTFRIACGRFYTPWELALFPPSRLEDRQPAMRWARALLIGHVAIFAIGFWTGCWWIPVLISLAPFYGGGLLLLLNNAQHIGLQDNVKDFRLCCRTVILNPFLRFIYWHMNFHTEHHMYAAVPCYRLGRLHALIRHDLPESPRGVVMTWVQIAGILRRQKADPAYQYSPPLPAGSAVEVNDLNCLKN